MMFMALFPLLFYILLVLSIIHVHYMPLTTASLLNSSRTKNRRSILSKIINNASTYDDDNEVPRKRQERRKKWRYKRLDIDEHFRMCLHTNTFSRRYHMSLESFEALVRILKIDISLDATKSMNSTSGNSPITPRMIVAMGLRYVGGEEVKSLADIFGMSIDSADRLINLFLKAVDSSKHHHLSIDMLPKSEMECQKLAMEWQQRSGAFHIFYGMLGAIDGWLCTIERPSDVDAPGDYFSGHYQRYGYNIQVMCDANLRITYLSVAGPGGKNDARVFRRLTRLRHWLMDLSAGYFIAGDNAYPLLKNVLIPFSGAAANVDCNDVYNFYLSQLRIRVEMTLGRLTCKWRIFRKNLPDQNGSKKNTMIIRVGAKLHNYVINSDNLNFLKVEDNDYDTIGIEPLVNGPKGNVGYLPIPPEEEEEVEFCRRLRIVEELALREMKRPSHNTKRN